MEGFAYDADRPLRRPRLVRRLEFEDVWRSDQHRHAPGVVPLELLQRGDTQAGVFREYGERPGDLGPPVPLDALAAYPDVDSVVGLWPVVTRTPLPNIRWLSAAHTDEETLRNLPDLEALAVWSNLGARAQTRIPIEAAALPDSLRWLQCDAVTFGAPESVAERFSGLERLNMSGLWRGESAEPLAAFGELRWLATDAAKGLHHLAKLSSLELLDLDLAEARLTNLKRFSKLPLRVLRLSGGGLKGLEGIEGLTGLTELELTRTTAVSDLTPLSGLPELASVRIEGAPRLRDLSALGTLPALRRLEVLVGDITADQPVPTLAWLDGLDALEELELYRLDVLDRDAGPLRRLRPLRRASVVGRFGAGEAELREAIQAPELVVVTRDEEDDGVAVGPVRYLQLGDGTWSIFSNVAPQLGTYNNHEAEDRVRGAIRDEDGALYDRLDIDSEPDALSILATSEDDVRRAATIIATLAER
jgi:hypothetical protein